MLNEDILNELIGMRPGSPVLSVYLDVSPQSGAADTTRLRVRQLVKDYAAQVPEDVEQVLHFIDHEFEGTSRSLAVFSCKAANIFKTFSFAVPVRSRARLLDAPYVKPLANLLESYGHIGVVLVDQQGVRLLHFHLGQLAAQEDVAGEEIRQTKHGSGSSSPGRRTSSGDPARYADELIERNMRQAADSADHFFKQNGVRRILVAASEPIAQPFIERLPKRWQTLVMGTFSIEITAPPALIFERAMTILQAAEQARDERMLEQVLDAAAKGGEGVVGLEATLPDVHAGRVKTLFIRDGYRAPGHRCQNCGYLSLRMPGSCPFCGGSIEYIEDAVEYAVQSVIANGGEVEVVAANPLTERMGNIGAQLRY
jgi:rubrerythrin